MQTHIVSLPNHADVNFLCCQSFVPCFQFREFFFFLVCKAPCFQSLQIFCMLLKNLLLDLEIIIAMIIFIAFYFLEYQNCQGHVISNLQQSWIFYEVNVIII